MNLIDNEKRYNTINRYYKAIYNKKVAKISLNANFTCPNKDGLLSNKGCIYCSKLGSGDFAGKKEKSLKEQFYDIKKIMDNKWNDCYYNLYFQANTNTYAPLEKLIEIYDEAYKINPLIKEISISTRCDCLDEEKIKYLSELNKKIKVNIELGLQSTHEKTLELLNTKYTVAQFDDTVKLLKKYNLNIIVHIINGLPYETHQMMLENIIHLNKLGINGLKIHSLMVIKDTLLEELYNENKFKLYTLEEHVNTTCDQIELLNEDVIIHRLSADCSKEDLVAPLWSLKKLVVMNEIDKTMRKRNSYQGIKKDIIL